MSLIRWDVPFQADYYELLGGTDAKGNIKYDMLPPSFGVWVRLNASDVIRIRKPLGPFLEDIQMFQNGKWGPLR